MGRELSFGQGDKRTYHRDRQGIRRSCGLLYIDLDALDLGEASTISAFHS